MRLPLDSLPAVASRSVCARDTRFAKWRSCACVLAAVVSTTGCRSSMPGMGMFGFKSEPSAEALAGVGPTATYPVSPSAGVSPEAIASTAAGTAAPNGTKPQTATYASVTPGTAAPAATTTPGTAAQTPNMAAASANGFYGSPSTGSLAASPATYANAAGTGYTYGQNPAASGSTSPVASGGGINAIAAGYVPPARPSTSSPAVPAYAQPSNMASAPTTTTPAAPTATPPASYAASVGYPLPGATPPQPTAPAAVTSTVPGFTMPPVASTAEAAKPSSAGGFIMPGAASETPSTTAPAPAAYQATAPTTPSSPSAPATGYTPGSTAGAVSYPSGGGYTAPTSGDSFYR